MNKEEFCRIYGSRFQKKLEKLSDEQHEMIINHIKKINPNIVCTEKEDYYLFNSDNLSVDDLIKIWDYINQF